MHNLQDEISYHITTKGLSIYRDLKNPTGFTKHWLCSCLDYHQGRNHRKDKCLPFLGRLVNFIWISRVGADYSHLIYSFHGCWNLYTAMTVLFMWGIFKSYNQIATTQLNQVRYQFCSRNRMRNGLFLPVLNDTFYVVLPRFAAPPAV